MYVQYHHHTTRICKRVNSRNVTCTHMLSRQHAASTTAKLVKIQDKNTKPKLIIHNNNKPPLQIIIGA